MKESPDGVHAEVSNPQQNGELRKSQALEVAAGLVVALVLPVGIVLGIPALLGDDMSTLVGLASMLLLTAAVVFLTVRVERRGWSGIGVRCTRVRDVMLSLGLGVALMLLVPALSLLGNLLLTMNGADITSAASNPWPLVLFGVLTAAVTEEVLFRSYPIERIAVLTKTPWPGAILGLAAFTVLHAGNWNLAHVLCVVLPLGLLLALIYVWRRSLLVVVIAHFVTDIPLVVLSIAGK